MSNKTLFESIDQYIGGLLAPEDDILRSTRESLSKAGMPQHSIFPNQGKLLQLLMFSIQAKRVLEIGTLGGYSTIWLARALPEDGQLISIELDKNYARLARNNIRQAGLEKKVEIRAGEALEVLEQLNREEQETFDLFFFDAHKPSYINYFNWAISRSRPGALIIADNVIRNGEVLNEQSEDEKARGVRSFHEMLSQRDDVHSTVILNASGNGIDGMSLAFVK